MCETELRVSALALLLENNNVARTKKKRLEFPLLAAKFFIRFSLS
jgi:hypothetical protein